MRHDADARHAAWGAAGSETQTQACVVTTLKDVLIVVVVGPLRVTPLALAGEVGGLCVQRQVVVDVVAEGGIQITDVVVPDRQLIAPRTAIDLTETLAAPVVGHARLQLVL